MDNPQNETFVGLKGTFDTDETLVIEEHSTLTSSFDLRADSAKFVEIDPTGSQSAVKATETFIGHDVGIDGSGHAASGLSSCPRCHEDLTRYHGGISAPTRAVSSTDESRVDEGSRTIVQRLDEMVKEVKSAAQLWRERMSVPDGHQQAGIKFEKDPSSEREERAVQTGDKEEETDKHEGETPEIDGKSEEEDDFTHMVEFRDNGNISLHTQRWDKPFRLESEVKDHSDVTAEAERIAVVTSVLETNIPMYHTGPMRPEDNRKEIVKAGFLNNPEVKISSVAKRILLISKPLIRALQRVVTYYPGVNLWAPKLTMWPPFDLLAHHMDQLEAYRGTYKPQEPTVASDGGAADASALPVPDNADCGEVAFRHIGKLIDFMKEDLFEFELKAEQDRHLQDPPVCTFDMLWLLYKPGTIIYLGAPGKVEAYIVEKFIAPVDEDNYSDSSFFDDDRDLRRPARLLLWGLSFEGTCVRRSQEVEFIGAFDGERSFLDLKAIPAKFSDVADEGKTRKELIERGQKCLTDDRVVIDIASYSSSHNASFNWGRGSTVSSGYDRDDSTFLRIGTFNVEDTGADRAVCPCEKCCSQRAHPPKNFPWTDYDVINPVHQKTLELPESHEDRQHRYLLCTWKLIGFALKSRTWELLDVACCQPPRFNMRAMDTLVMPKERKRMIRAIVQKYTDPRFTPSAQTWGADFIENKGEGQIFLLHGGPGVGKTYTAECISELIGRPLLSLTCADFGIDEVEMERNLSKWFRLAEAWGAVLLLDEADVWLERRLIADLKRNTLVAVFLRCLEYYRGILFLTSNRVGTFDNAFISRIHVVIYYEELGETERKQIWNQSFDKLERERKDTIIVESRAKHYVLNDSEMRKIPWNGREIRNAYQTAVSLAEYRFNFEGGKDKSDMVVLDKVDFEQLCQMSIDFKKYLKAVHSGADENERAMKDRTRVDVF